MSHLGQYFTKSQELQDAIMSAFEFNPYKCLEPSAGKGDIIKCVKNKYPDTEWTSFEIDETITQYNDIPNSYRDDFLSCNSNSLFDTIVGNPPYVKRQKRPNLYIAFLSKCLKHLEDGGQLIMVLPSEFIRGTHASHIIQWMNTNGRIRYIYHPNREDLFESAAIDVIVFTFVRDINLHRTVRYNGKTVDYSVDNGMFQTSTGKRIGDYFYVYVGMVSGCDNIFKNRIGNINVLTGKGSKEKFIYIDEYPSGNEEIDKHLFKNKERLLRRQIRSFHEDNWFQWGAPRNKSCIDTNWGKDCIYVFTVSRSKTVAFCDTVQYFGGSLLMLLPKNENCDIHRWVSAINNDKERFQYSGRFRITHKQITNSRFEV